MANQLTRSELKAKRQRNITTPLNSQNTAELVGEMFDALIDSTGNPADDGQPTPGAGAGSFAALSGRPDDNAALAAQLRGIENRPPNLRPDSFKSVRVVSPASPLYQSGNTTRAALNSDFLSIGTECRTEFADDGTSGGQHDVLIADYTPRSPANSGLYVWNDGSYGYKLPAKWVALTSASATTKSYPAYPANYSFPTATYVAAYVTGQSTEQFFKRRAPGGAAPAPAAGGDATYWELVSAADVPTPAAYQPIAQMTEAAFLTRYNDKAIGLYAGKTILVTDRAGGAGNVAFPVYGSGTIGYDDAYLFNPANTDEQATPVVVAITPMGLLTGSHQMGPSDTDALPEGASNKYFTASRENAIYQAIDTLPIGTTADEKNLLAGRYIIGTTGIARMYESGSIALNNAIASLVAGETFSFAHGGRQTSTLPTTGRFFENVTVRGNGFTWNIGSQDFRYLGINGCRVSDLTLQGTPTAYAFLSGVGSQFTNCCLNYANVTNGSSSQNTSDENGVVTFVNCKLNFVNYTAPHIAEYYGTTTSTNQTQQNGGTINMVVRYALRTVNGQYADVAGNITAGGSSTLRDVYDVPQAMRDAVMAGTYSSGELQGAQPAGSLAGFTFTTATYGYAYQRGAAGALVWNRFIKS